MTATVTLENLTVSYKRHPAIHHVSGIFNSGSLTAIAGPNGAGKSTLLKAIAKLVRIDEGCINMDNKQEPFAYLPQMAELQRDFPISILHMITTGSWKTSRNLGAITHNIKEQASIALNKVGLSGFEHRTLQSLSTGQFQRAMFARLLLQDAPLILLDEPFAAVDAETTLHLLDIIHDLHLKGHTIICVLHDLDHIRNYFPECLLLARECIAWGKTKDILSAENLLKARFFREHWATHEENCRQAV